MSAPETRTFSLLIAKQFTIALWPVKFWKKKKIKNFKDIFKHILKIKTKYTFKIKHYKLFNNEISWFNLSFSNFGLGWNIILKMKKRVITNKVNKLKLHLSFYRNGHKS